MIMHQTPPDANQKVTEFEAWVKISENTSLFCELVDKPDVSIWDDDAEEPSTSSGSGLRREVTPGVASSSQPPPQQMQALRENMEEQDLIDALDDALEKDEPVVGASSSTTPVDERRRKTAKNKIELEPELPVEADPYQEKPISVKDDVEEEEINVEFLAQLIAADEANERKDRRQQLLK